MSRSSNPLFPFEWVFPLLKEQLLTLHQQLQHWQHLAYLPTPEVDDNLASYTGSDKEPERESAKESASTDTDPQRAEHSEEGAEPLLAIAEQYQQIFTKLETAELADFAALTQQLEATIKAIAIQYLPLSCIKSVLDASEQLLQQLNHRIDLGSYQRQPLLDSLQQLQALFAEAEVIANDTVNTTNANTEITTAVSDVNPTLQLLQPYIEQLVIPADAADCDPEIKDIFLEEAEEVLQDIEANLQHLSNLTADKQALTTIRRGFHTLKGSGRMAGAFYSAELAWAIENMLNRVLEGSIEEAIGMHALVADVVAAYPDLMRSFQQGSPYPQQFSVWMAAANVYAKNQHANFDYTQTVQADIPSVEQASDTQSALEADKQSLNKQSHLPQLTQQAEQQATPHLAQPGPALTSISEEVGEGLLENLAHANARLQQEAQQAQLASIALDSVLQQVFVEEASVLLETINELLSNAQSQAQSASFIDDMVRAFHTLRGAANSQGLSSIGDICATVEQSLELLQQHDQPLSDCHLQMIGQSVTLIEQYIQHHIQQEQGEQLPQDMQQLQQAFDKSVPIPIEASMTPNENGSHLSVAHLIEGIDALLDAEWQLPHLLASHDSLTVDYSLTTDRGKSLNIQKSDIQQPGSKHLDNQHIVDYFNQLVAQSQLLLAKVRQSTKFVTLIEALQHLYQAIIEQPQLFVTQLVAEQQPQNPSETISSQQDSHRPIPHTPQIIDTLIDTLTEGHEQLLGLFDSLAGSMALKVDNEVVERLHQVAIQLSQLPLSTVNTEVEAVEVPDAVREVGAVEVADTDTTQGIGLLLESADTDAALLAIFVEEAQALDEDSNQQFALWRQDPQNQEVIQVLQRHLHTIKGGARMAGIESIAALSHEAESLYEYFANQQIAVTPAWVALMQSVQDILSTQIEQLAKQGQSFYVPHIIEQLQQLAQRKQLEAGYQLPPLSLPSTVSQRPVASEQQTTVSSDTTDSALSDAVYPPSSETVAPTVTTEVAIEAQATETDTTADINSIELEFDRMKSESWEGHSPDPDILSVFLEEADDIISTLPDLQQQLWQAIAEDAPVADSAQQPEQKQTLLTELQRALHLLKGGAHMVQATATVEVADALQAVYHKLEQHNASLPALTVELLAMSHTWLAQAVYLLGQGINPPKAQALVSQLQRISKQPDNIQELPEVSLQEYVQAVTRYESWRDARLGLRDISQMPPYLAPNEQEDEVGNTSNEMIRVPTRVMEQMINLSGESAINRSRIELSMSSVSSALSEMGSTVKRLAEQLRRMDIELEAQVRSQLDDKYLQVNAAFDPLEMDQYSALNQLSKSLAESASDLLDIKTTLENKTQDTEALLLQLAQTQTQLQQGLMTSRMVPFSRLMPRLQRIVRQTASELGKSVQLTVINKQDEIDRTILERISSPLEHMLRNAVDHGIETPDERRKQGKPAEGRIVIDITREGSEIVIRLQDDGQGIDVASVRRKAVSRGLIAADDDHLTDLEVMQYIFHAGLSTASNLTQISGRGVGMDVVLSEVRKLGGSVSAQSQAGQGTEFVLRLPLTIAVSDALVVRAGEQTFAIPLLQIERIERIPVQQLVAYYYADAGSALDEQGRHSNRRDSKGCDSKERDSKTKSSGFQIAGSHYRLRYLTQMLFNTALEHHVVPDSQSAPVILLKTQAGQPYALHVDEIVGSRVELVVKPLGRPLSTITGLSAATITADGSVMLILDALALMRNAPPSLPPQMLTQAQSDSQAQASSSPRHGTSASTSQLQQSRAQPQPSQLTEKGKSIQPKVLIVDDSVTVRKVTSRILTRQGYQTYVARDGVEAVALLQTLRPDLMLLDIEMPRMDGFEVAAHVRHDSDTRLQNLPIIMITSRTGDKHRQRAQQLGVNDYMGKPFQEATLISSIQRLLGQQSAEVSD